MRRRPAAGAPVAYQSGTSLAGLITRIILTVIGAAALILGGFLTWYRPRAAGGLRIAGTDLDGRAYYTVALTRAPHFVSSAGAVMILLGLLALVGLAPRTGWLTRLVGALGIVGFVLYVITLARAAVPGGTLATIGTGAWVCLAGGVICLAGGFSGTRRVVRTTAARGTYVEEP